MADGVDRFRTEHNGWSQRASLGTVDPREFGVTTNDPFRHGFLASFILIFESHIDPHICDDSRCRVRLSAPICYALVESWTQAGSFDTSAGPKKAIVN